MNKRMRRYIKTKKEPAVPEYAINEERESVSCFRNGAGICWGS